MKVIFFDSLNVAIPVKRVYTRLGYAQGKTKLGPAQKDKVESFIEQAGSLLSLKGAASLLPTEKIESGQVFLSKGVCFKSKAVADLLTGCPEVLVMAATAGDKIIQAIQRDSSGENVMRAVVFDAVASETADAGLDWITNYFNSQLSRKNMRLSPRRFSAGYGDFSLENQKTIYKILELEKIGVTLSPEYLLIPEKTVTAICGVRSNPALPCPS